MSHRSIDRRLASGRLIAMHAGVYRPDGHPRSWEQALMAAALAGGEGAVVSHRGAGYLLGLGAVDPCAEISVAIPRARRIPGIVVHRTTALGPPDTTVIRRIPCTRPARTLIDLAGVVTPTTLEVALDDLLSRRVVTVDYVRRRIAALGRQGRRGAGLLVQLLADRADGRPRTTSEFERRLLAVLKAANVPRPWTQYEVALPGRRRAVLDYAFPDVLLALEADSYRHHSSRLDWSRDHVRNRLLTAIGWRILPVTWDELDDPGEMIDAVRRGLREKPPSAG